MGLSLTFFTFKHSVLFSFLIFHLAIGHFISSFQPLCHDHERSALLNFKESLVINRTASGYPSAYPKVASWKLDEKNSDCCLWDGVKCNEDTGHVVELDLASSCLYGSVNSTSSLFQLVHLQRLSLFDNNFNFSEIPSEILNFSRLTHLNLSRSYFSGQIPAELLELTNLEVLDLSFNTFDNFFLKLQKPGLANLAENLTNLKALDLINVFISSTVPHTLANLSSLRFLSLSGCHLQGEFPQEIFQLPNLQFLGVMINPNLTGYLPQFQKSSPLEDLRLSYTRFSGKIPDSIENLESLSYLGISHCSFVGKIPSSLGNLTKLEDLYLSGGNGFSNELPPSIGNLASLKTLEISSFNFSGTLQASLGNLTQLDSLTISDSNFSGPMSSSLSWLTNLNQLTSLNFPNCNLNGEIPSGISNLTQLTALDLSDNQLTGPIPYWLMNLKKVSLLYLGSNQLSGRILVEISNLTQLQELQLSWNQLEGSVPSSIFELRNLEELDLYFNNLSGTVDLNMFLLSFKRLKKFEIIGLRSCNLSEFPSFLHNQDQLISLDLSSNMIAGKIPEWLFSAGNLPSKHFECWNAMKDVNANNLTYLQDSLLGPVSYPAYTHYGFSDYSLTLSNKGTEMEYEKLSNLITATILSNNSFVGEIPTSISNLKGLRTLNLSNNNLQGHIPPTLGNLIVDA
ncbi:hypothetical protein CUMW_234060 [Citrus unshiu]|uniref:Uncharacterized protein n=1 Tax=Citrus unshiu TaxID=55188 RepID=A0A2H5QIP4_CITUN|nr:hypothetical protein CUMW_234060 [Citrus unshiu]